MTAPDEKEIHEQLYSRNLVAHAGLEKNITLVTLVDEVLCLEYREDVLNELVRTVARL